MMRAAEKGLKQESIQDCNTVSVKTLRYSVKFDVRQKKKKINRLYRNVIFCRGWTSKKFWHTAMAHSAID